MRILISNQGKKQLQELQSDWDDIKEEKSLEKQIRFERSDQLKRHIKRRHKLTTIKHKSPIPSLTYLKTDSPSKQRSLSPSPRNRSKVSFAQTQSNFSNVNNNNLINFNNQEYSTHGISEREEEPVDSFVEEVKVKQKRIIMPKSIQEKYNKETNENAHSIIVPTLPSDLSNTRKLYNKDGSKKKFLNVKDILNYNTIETLKKNKLRAKRVKELNTVINHDTFRTNYAEKDVLDELNEKLDVDIDINKINLIKYLHEKDKVSEKFIKQFESYSEEKLNKLNKICQIITYQNEMEKIDKDLIKEKIKMNLDNVKKNYKTLIDDVENDICFSNAILQPYKNKINKQAIYGDIFRETKRHWEKINADKLQRRKFNQGVVSNENTAYGGFDKEGKYSKFPSIMSTLNTKSNFYPLKTESSKQQTIMQSSKKLPSTQTGGFISTNANFFSSK